MALDLSQKLVRRLLPIMREATDMNIMEAMTQARSIIDMEKSMLDMENRREHLEELFMTQIATLRDTCCVHKQIIDGLLGLKGLVINIGSKTPIGEGNIPFLPVIGPSFMSYQQLMEMVRKDELIGLAYSSANSIYDLVNTPKRLYYMYDIENGQATYGLDPYVADKQIEKNRRSSLTAAEGIILCALTKVLSERSVWVAGSRGKFPTPAIDEFGQHDGVPGIYLGEKTGRPMIDWGSTAAFSKEFFKNWGTPSCAERR